MDKFDVYLLRWGSFLFLLIKVLGRVNNLNDSMSQYELLPTFQEPTLE